MSARNAFKEIAVVILAALILAAAVSFADTSFLWGALIMFIIIIGINVGTKKLIGNFFEIAVTTKFWSIQRYGFLKNMYFKKPLTMAWAPLIGALLSKGSFIILALLEFDVSPKTERVARKHGLYRFTQVTEWHMAWIATWGIIANVLLGILAYFIGFEDVARYSLYFAMWSALPLSSLDGSKIIFSSRILWFTVAILLGILFIWTRVIF